MHSSELQIFIIKVSHFQMENLSYILSSKKKEAVIIDPAWEINKYTKVIGQNHLMPKGILLTHGHYDHVNLANKLAERYDLPIFLSKEDSLFFPSSSRVQNVVHDKKFFCGELQITPLHTPGHTLGSFCYEIYDHVFTGDTLFIEGCGMCFDENSDPKRLFQSLQILKKTLSHEKKIYPGHCYGDLPGITFDIVLRKNIYLHIQDEESFINFRMRNNQKKLFHFL